MNSSGAGYVADCRWFLRSGEFRLIVDQYFWKLTTGSLLHPGCCLRSKCRYRWDLWIYIVDHELKHDPASICRLSCLLGLIVISVTVRVSRESIRLDWDWARGGNKWRMVFLANYIFLHTIAVSPAALFPNFGLFNHSSCHGLTGSSCRLVLCEVHG